MSDKIRTYLVSVTVLEGRHYIWDNMNSAVIVRVDNKKKTTAVRRKTDCPFYNEYFVFELETTLENLKEKNILITVIQPRTCLRERKILGTIIMDVATVLNQKNSQFYHKWAVLTSPKAASSNIPTGYLKMDISVLSRGQSPKILTNVVNDDIEGNLLMPQGFIQERQRACFNFNIHRCEVYLEGLNNYSVQVIITFAGTSVKTTQKRSNNVVFNEKLTIVEMFPPLCQRIKVEVSCSYITKSIKLQHYVNLRQISSDANEGFLPTFGPSYIYLYLQQRGRSHGAKLLLSMDTDMHEDTIDQKRKPLDVDENMFPFDEVQLFVGVFDVTNIPLKYDGRDINLRVTMGKEDCGFRQPPIKTKKLHLKLDGKKPCLQLKCRLPDFRRRMYNSNMLGNILKFLEDQLERAEELMVTNQSGIDDHLNDTMDGLLAQALKYVDNVKNRYNFNHPTTLDGERVRMCLRTMTDIINSIKSAKSVKNKFQSLDDYRRQIQSISDDPQPCWPDVYLWMGFSHVRLPARTIAYSDIPEEMGGLCGQVQTLLLQDKTMVVCKVDALFWLGLDSQRQEFISRIPQGFTLDNGHLVSTEQHKLQAQAFIFQGDIIPGFDKSGLVDAFVEVSICGLMKKTQVKSKALVPTWDQTLVFPEITVYGGESFIRENPPSVLVEMFDEDPLSVEFIGRNVVTPKVFPQFEGKLEYYSMYNDQEVFGRILAAFHLTKGPGNKVSKHIIPVPKSLKPVVQPYKIEILFWGVRNLKKINLIRINRPKITFTCGSKTISSSIIENACRFSNFVSNISISMEVNLPQQSAYPQVFQFKMYDNRRFGVYILAGLNVSCTTPYLITPIGADERLKLLSAPTTSNPQLQQGAGDAPNWQLVQPVELTLCDRLRRFFKPKLQSASVVSLEDETEADDLDWWTKFYVSTGEFPKQNMETLQIYPYELEEDFDGFSDLIRRFDMFRGKRTGDEILDEQLTSGVFKGAVKIYQWPLEGVWPNGRPVTNGVFASYPLNTALKYVVRVYCVRGINLRPKDLSGTSDPYVQVQLGKQILSNIDEYAAGDVNPIFGKCFEFHASFPECTEVTVRVYDYDVTSQHDLIGETVIDIENRFYTKHRAYCGIASSYQTSGYCQWRDQKKPCEILKSLCKEHGLVLPVYSADSVKVHETVFKTANQGEDFKQALALEALNNFQKVPLVGFKLVPEHVETRSLYDPSQPGIEQGKIQMWIDLFPKTNPIPDKVNVAARKAESYELRVIVWNTEDVTLKDDELFTGEKKSDIYVKGWMEDPYKYQTTDIHYRSLTGEGNFNWRFIFNFDYLSSENKLLIQKIARFSQEKTSIKMPCVLNLQIWDNDTFSADDFLGSLTLELSKMPRGARFSKKCSLSMMNVSKKMNLFKVRRTRGWWPFLANDKATQTVLLGGKLEAELELLSKEDALKNPVGVARQGPNPLPPPKRPDTSYTWFKNPLKSLKHIVCDVWRCKIIKGCLFCFLVFFIVLAVYTLPGISMEKLFNLR